MTTAKYTIVDLPDGTFDIVVPGEGTVHCHSESYAIECAFQLDNLYPFWLVGVGLY